MKDGQNKRKGKKQSMLLYTGLLYLCLHISLVFLHSSYSESLTTRLHGFRIVRSAKLNITQIYLNSEHTNPIKYSTLSVAQVLSVSHNEIRYWYISSFIVSYIFIKVNNFASSLLTCALVSCWGYKAYHHRKFS